MVCSKARGAVGVADRGVGAFKAAGAVLGLAGMGCGEVGLRTGATLNGVAAPFLVMSGLEAFEVLGIVVVWSGFFDAASALK